MTKYIIESKDAPVDPLITKKYEKFEKKIKKDYPIISKTFCEQFMTMLSHFKSGKVFNREFFTDWMTNFNEEMTSKYKYDIQISGYLDVKIAKEFYALMEKLIESGKMKEITINESYKIVKPILKSEIECQ